MKKRISIMLILIMLMQVLLPMLNVILENKTTSKSVAATDEILSENWEYVVNDDNTTITIIKYKGTDSYLDIPSQIDGYVVTGLGNGNRVDATHNTYSVFKFGYCINEIRLPDTMKKIAHSAFVGCKNLTDIELNEGLEVIGDQAFIGCKKLKDLDIPSTVQSLTNDININPFDGCSSLENIMVNENNQYFSSSEGVLFNKEKTVMISYPEAKKEKSYVIPESVVKVFGNAINNANLESLYISKNINSMKANKEYSWAQNIWAITGSPNLNNIIVDEANKLFSSESGVLYNADKSKLIFYPSGKKENYFNIPSTVNSCETTFSNPYVEKIKINALISDVSFLMNMQNLKNIEVDEKNSNYMQKNGVLFNKGGNIIIYYPIGKDDEKYEIDNEVTEIASNAFKDSKISQVILSSNLITIGDKAFYNCINLKNITIPRNVTEIGDAAFYNCKSINKLIFEENSKIRQIGYRAFGNCSNIEELNIPECTIKTDAFSGEDKLRIINIPSTVSNISSYMFNSTYTRAQIITINNENPTIDGIWAFSNPDYGITIIRCHSTAKEIINWTNSHGFIHYNLIDLNDDDVKFLYEVNDQNEIVIQDYIGDEKNVVIPSQIEGRPVVSVAKCYGTYQTLTIPSTVKKIGSIYSSNLENIYVDNENKFFTSKEGVLFSKDEQELIYYPMGKKEELYKIPEGTILIGGNMSVTVGNTYYAPNPFYGNMYLKSLYIPSSVSEINADALKGMESLGNILVEQGNKNYITKDNILYKVDEENIKIEMVPNKIEGDVELLYGLTNINTYTFENMNNIESVVVPTTVKSISHNAFIRCNNLKKLVITGSTTELSEINDDNLSFGNASDKLKVYCEYDTEAQKFARKWDIDYEIIEPTKIEIKKNPKKLSYIEGEDTLNLEDGLITITYNDGTVLDLTMTSSLLKINGFDNSKVGKNLIEVDYKGRKANFFVNVVGKNKKLIGIRVTTEPNKKNYLSGDNFDKSGMKIVSTYSDGSTKEITDYKVIDGTNLTAGKTSVTISYTENGITKETTQNITVTEKLQIEIDNYTEYKEENTSYIKNILPNTTIKEFSEKVKTNGEIKIYKESEEILDKNVKMTTGMKIKVVLDNEQIEYETVVKGDINGDGKISLVDLANLKLSMVGKRTLSTASILAGDINGDGKTSLNDLAKLKMYLVGKINI